MKNVPWYQIFKLNKDKGSMSDITVMTNKKKAIKHLKTLKLKNGENSVLGKMEVLMMVE